jgi:hypothetical protein
VPVALALLLPASLAHGQAIQSRGTFSLFAGWAEQEDRSGQTSDLGELIASLSFYSEVDQNSRFEFGLDARVATWDASDRDERVSLYDAWVGVRGLDGRWTLRLGQMWLRDLGGIGSVGGLFGEYRFLKQSSIGRFRLGLFGGGEPEIMDAGYADGVTKMGGYVAVDGAHGRRHVLGYVRIDNDDLTERSVVVFSNFIPVGRKFFLYQVLEYDLAASDALQDDELSYFFANLRYSPIKKVDFQLSYHRGVSIDARSIADDILDGRPVSPERLQGLLFESSRFRVTVFPNRHLRVWGSYGRDRDNQGDEEWYGRYGLGISFIDLFNVGLDLTASNTKVDRADESYDNTYISLGKSFGRRVYISLDYISSLSVFRYDDEEGVSVELRPESDRYSLSTNINLNRSFSLFVIGELFDGDDYEERRVLTGLTLRF